MYDIYIYCDTLICHKDQIMNFTGERHKPGEVCPEYVVYSDVDSEDYVHIFLNIF